jgi:Ca2+-binding EF-hand superfamily protein
MLVIWRIVDENKDGVLNFEEFLGFYDFLEFLKELFNKCDTDKTGNINRKELNVLLKQAGYNLSAKQTELLYRMCDEDGSGTIELDDFLSLILFIIWAQILFANTDTDGNDVIEFVEFKSLLDDLGIPLPASEVKKDFDELDVDKDGTLKFEEYLELIFALRYPIISDIVKAQIEVHGFDEDPYKEKVEFNDQDRINIMEASGFFKRSRHMWNFQSSLTNEQIENFRTIFKAADKDKSGTINILELAVLLAQIGYRFTPSEVLMIIQIVDDNMDGVLNFNEFLGFYDFLEYLQSLFASADTDGDGGIKKPELKSLFEKAGYQFNDSQIDLFYMMLGAKTSGILKLEEFFSLTLFIFWAQILFNKADTDGNDSVDLIEFNNALRRLGLLMPPQIVAEFFAKLDTDGNGTLNFNEYIEVIFMLRAELL